MFGDLFQVLIHEGCDYKRSVNYCIRQYQYAWNIIFILYSFSIQMTFWGFQILLDFLSMWYCCFDIHVFVGLYQRETSHHEVSSNGGHQRGTKERQRSRNEEACPQIYADSKRSVCVQTVFVKYWVDDIFLCYVVACKKLTLYEH